MMTQQPGSSEGDSWEMNESAALLSVTDEAGKWVRTTGWLAAQLGQDTRQPGQRGGGGLQSWRGGGLHHGNREPAAAPVDGNVPG